MKINNSDILSLRSMQGILLIISSRFLAVNPDIWLYPWNSVSFVLHVRHAFYLWYMKYGIFNGKKNPLCLDRKKFFSKYSCFLNLYWKKKHHTVTVFSIIASKMNRQNNTQKVDKFMNAQTKCGISLQWNNIQPYKESTNTCYIMDESWKNYAKWKKPNTKGHIYSIYTQYPELANSQRQKADEYW